MNKTEGDKRLLTVVEDQVRESESVYTSLVSIPCIQALLSKYKTNQRVEQTTQQDLEIENQEIPEPLQKGRTDINRESLISLSQRVSTKRVGSKWKRWGRSGQEDGVTEMVTGAKQIAKRTQPETGQGRKRQGENSPDKREGKETEQTSKKQKAHTWEHMVGEEKLAEAGISAQLRRD